MTSSDRLLVPKRCRGFTLAEILVVLLVIGIAAGLAYAQLDRDPRQALEREGRRFAGALEHAALLAQWKNETLGVSANGGAYRFWHRVSDSEGERWLALSGSRRFSTAPAEPRPSPSAWPTFSRTAWEVRP